MSTERDELIELVLPILEKCFDSDWNMTYSEMVTDAILAAGYRKPRTISTAEELDALPEGAMIFDDDPDALLKVESGRWLSLHDGDGVPYTSAAITFPATVLHTPEPTP